MIWSFANSCLSILLITIIIYKLTHCRDAFNSYERIGLGLIGGAAMMRIAVWWNDHSPFDNWSATLWLVGVNFYFGGRLYRNLIHARRNAEQIKIAKQHMQKRGG